MEITRNKKTSITLILLGGGIRFPAFVGALKAIEEKGLKVTKVVGAGSGSIVGALYATGMTSDELRKVVLDLDPSQFKDFSLKSVFTGKGLYAGKKLEEWVDDKLAGKRFGDGFRIPPQIIATDILNYKPVVFSAASFPDFKVATAARCSVGVPWIFAYSPVTYGGKNHIFIDGTLMSGTLEESFGRHERVLILKVISKRTLHQHIGESLSMRRYFLEMLNFSLHSMEKEFIKGGKWKDTILLYCADIPPAKFILSQEEKGYLLEQGYEQTLKYLEYKWGI